MFKFKTLYIGAIALLCLTGYNSCNGIHNKSNSSIKDEVASSPVTQASQESTGDQQLPQNDSIKVPATAKHLPDPDWDKKIIKTASLKLEVPDFKKYNDIVYNIVHQSGGYIAQEDQNLSAEKNETIVIIKVPVYQFEKMMNELPGTDTKVMERKISTDDVTGKIIDTRSRLEAKKEMRLKYLEFLKQSKNMKEVLEVQGEINNIQEEMEAAAGQVNYLSHQSAMSTINLSFYQLLPGYKPDPIEDPGFASRVARAFKFGAGALVDLFIGLMTIWPLTLIIIASLIIWKRSRTIKWIPVVKEKKNS